MKYEVYINKQYDLIRRFMFKVIGYNLTNTISNDNLLSSKDILNMIKKGVIISNHNMSLNDNIDKGVQKKVNGSETK